jgi:uncharacterized glyoxalase superfamily protein PhnB
MKHKNFISFIVIIFLFIFGLNNCNSQQKESEVKQKPLKFEHIATNVDDPVQVANWYKDNMGMKIIRQGEAPTFTTFIADSAENMMFEFYHNAEAVLFNPSQYNPMSIHIAFITSDINAIKEALLKAGASIAVDLKLTDSGDKVLTLRDPWGLPIQFVERANPMLKSNGLRFEHIAINVKDSRAVAKWLIDNYGMITMHESNGPNYGIFIADSAKNVMLELYQNSEVPVINFNEIDFNSLHLASMSSDLTITKNKLLKAGASVAQDINITPSGDQILVLRDPWGFPLQFVIRVVPMLDFN